MHQPDYRPPGSAVGLLPWVRLHGVRGYTDLLSILLHAENAQCCVNFSGILLEQLMAAGTQHRDTYAELSLRDPVSFDASERLFVVKHFFAANAQTLIKPHRRYWELYTKRSRALMAHDEANLDELFTDEELRDILVWFNLAWIGFTGQKLPDVRSLVLQGRGFDVGAQQEVIRIHESLLAAVLPAYAELAKSGRIELSCTPHYHPILPLICDLAGEGYYDESDPLPEFSFPQDAAAHISLACETFVRAFGFEPQGMWPAEGSVSNSALHLLADAGVGWAATDQQNLPGQVQGPLAHLSPWRWEQDGKSIVVFFRDTRLSDNIGFDYASWQPTMAAQHFVDMVRSLGRQSPFAEPVVSVFLDGENAWEHYPDGGEAFLSMMFERLAESGEIHCTTPAAAVRHAAGASLQLPTIHSIHGGSWIGGNFNIWSRHSETRKAWRELARARKALDSRLKPEVLKPLLKAQGSDTFWWYGDDFVSDSNETFDLLYRLNLMEAYEQAELPVPDSLHLPICEAFRQEALPQPSGLIEPVLDGRVQSYFEWLGAVEVDLIPAQGSMARSSGLSIAEMRYGFSSDSLFVCLTPAGRLFDRLRELGGQLRINLTQGELDFCVGYRVQPGSAAGPISSEFGLDIVGEFRLRIEQTGLRYGETAYLSVEVQINGESVQRFPPGGRTAFKVIASDFALENWVV